MRRVLCASLLLATLPAALYANPGTPDHIRAASLLVPYFSTGIDSSVHPDDTLLVVTNEQNADQIIHVQVWDRDGHAVALQINILLHAFQTWDTAMRDFIATASPTVKAQLTVGAFYTGFVTIDAVTGGTSMNPLQGGYPFSAHNYLEGYIYYTRLAEGSANGLSMVPLEAVSPSVDAYLRDFYPGGSREEIDADGRLCAAQLANGISPCTGDTNGVLDRVHFRQFGFLPFNGTTKLVVFTWEPFITGAGPSVICDAPMSGCASDYPFKLYRPDGSTVIDTTVRLNHVVNTFTLVGYDTSGWASIWNIPNIGADLQVYGFSFNSANPASGPSQSWDAIFEAYIVP